MQLDDRDRLALALLGTRVRPLSVVADRLDIRPEELDDRFAKLAENGLVVDRGGGRYGRTESGRRVLVSSQPGVDDERVDTPSEVERAIEESGIGPDGADAVRRAFVFLRYWGRAVEEEIVDAVYSEAPAGHETPDRWWDELLRDPLAELPGVEPPDDDETHWRYTGVPEADGPATDGRRVLSEAHPVYGDVKHTLESLDLTAAEREAARAAFRSLYRRGEVTESEVLETVYPEHPAGYGSPGSWWDGVVRRVFDSLPGVERAGESMWRYRGAER